MGEPKGGEKPELPAKIAKDQAGSKALEESQQLGNLGHLTGRRGATIPPAELILTSPYKNADKTKPQSEAAKRVPKDIPTGRPLVTTRPDGTVIEKYNDKTITTWSDGTVMEERGDEKITTKDNRITIERNGKLVYRGFRTPDGRDVEQYPDKTVTTEPDGTVIQELDNDNTTIITEPDGTVTEVRPNKTTVTRSDGTVVEKYRDKTVTTWKDGTVEEERGNEKITTTNKGNCIVKERDGKFVYRYFKRPDGTVIKDYPDKTITTEPDGTVFKELDNHSTMITYKPDGTVIEDRGKNRTTTKPDGTLITEQDHKKTTITPNGIKIEEDGNEKRTTRVGITLVERDGNEVYKFYKDGQGRRIELYPDKKITKELDGSTVEESGGKKITTKLDGTIITKANDGSFSEVESPNGKIHRITRYPEGGYLEQTYLKKDDNLKPGDIDAKVKSVDIDAKDIGPALELAEKKMEEIKKKYPGISFSTDSDEKITYKDKNKDKTYAVRAPILAELKVIERALERFPLTPTIKEKGLKFTFSKGEPFSSTAGYCDSFNQQIVFNSNLLARSNMNPQIDENIPYWGEQNFADTVSHELGHVATYSRYGAWGEYNSQVDMLMRKDLNEKYGFVEAVDKSDKDKTVLAMKISQKSAQSCTTSSSGQSFDLIKVIPTASGMATLQPCDKDLKPIGEAVSYEEAKKMTEVGLATLYACTDGMEADAEGKVLLARGPNSRLQLIKTRSEDDRERLPRGYQRVVAADAKDIAMAYPPSKKHPNGWMRAVSGEIVERTPTNIKALSDWEAAHSFEPK